MPASKRITGYIKELVEDWKWSTPVWSHNGNVVAIGAFRDHVKVNLFKGASLADPRGLFNAGLEAKTSRAIDIRQGEAIDAAAFKDVVRAAAALNRGKTRPKKRASAKKPPRSAR